MTPSFLVDKFKETFGLLGYYIQFLGNCFACFLFEKFIDVVVIVLRGLEIRKVSGATCTMLGATFHLFVLPLQTLMYKTDENKKNGNLRMQNVTGNETLLHQCTKKIQLRCALMYILWTIQFRSVET